MRGTKRNSYWGQVTRGNFQKREPGARLRGQSKTTKNIYIYFVIQQTMIYWWIVQRQPFKQGPERSKKT